MIKKTSKGYVVMNHTGKTPLSHPYKTRAAAIHRMRQIEWFKWKSKK